MYNKIFFKNNEDHLTNVNQLSALKEVSLMVGPITNNCGS